MKSKKNLFINVACIALAYFNILAIANLFSVYLRERIDVGIGDYTYNMYSVFVAALNYILLRRAFKREDKRLHVICTIYGVILAFLMVAGAYIITTGQLFEKGQIWKIVLSTVSLTGICAPVVEELFVAISRLGEKGLAASKKEFRLNYFVSWAIIFVSYIPLFLCQWPGNVIADAKYQLTNAAAHTYKQHHPLIHSLMMGIPYNFGIKIGNPSLGFSIYTILQMLLLSACFAYAVWYVQRKFNRKGVTIGFLLFFAIFPTNQLFAISATKDVLFAGFFLAFVLFLTRRFVDGEAFGIANYIGLVVTGVLSVLFRNNALYALVAGVFVLLFLVSGLRKKGELVAVTVAVILLATIANKGMIKAVNAIPAAPNRETFAIPLQCLARVAKNRTQELGPQLYQEICEYIPEEDIYKYSMLLADPVKERANEELLRTNKVNFIKLWIKVGLRFPGEYAEAILANTYGYWKIGEKAMYGEGNIVLYHQLIENGYEIEKENLCPLVYPIYIWLYWQQNYTKVPILSLLMRCDIYIWALLLGLGYSIYKKKKESASRLVLPLAYFATCLLGPIAYTRYVYCLIVICPILMLELIVPSVPSISEMTDQE